MSMRYTHEHPLGRWSEDGTRFEFNREKVAKRTGYSVEEVDALGIVYCIVHPLPGRNVPSALDFARDRHTAGKLFVSN
jgi:hypothetical protein